MREEERALGLLWKLINQVQILSEHFRKESRLKGKKKQWKQDKVQ